MFDEIQIRNAISASHEAAHNLRKLKAHAHCALPAVGHMPFPGHRDQAAIERAKCKTAKARAEKARKDAKAASARNKLRMAKEYGFEPESLKGGK